MTSWWGALEGISLLRRQLLKIYSPNEFDEIAIVRSLDVILTVFGRMKRVRGASRLTRKNESIACPKFPLDLRMLPRACKNWLSGVERGQMSSIVYVRKFLLDLQFLPVLTRSYKLQYLNCSTNELKLQQKGLNCLLNWCRSLGNCRKSNKSCVKFCYTPARVNNVNSVCRLISGGQGYFGC